MRYYYGMENAHYALPCWKIEIYGLFWSVGMILLKHK